MKRIGLVVACGLLLAGCQEKPPQPKVFTSVQEAKETLQVLDNLQFNYCRIYGTNVKLIEADRSGAKAFLIKQGMTPDEAETAGGGEGQMMLNATQQLQNDPAAMSKLCIQFMKMEEVRRYLAN